jgi:hypothetical protein
VQAGLDERNMAKVVDRIVFVCAPKVLQAFWNEQSTSLITINNALLTDRRVDIKEWTYSQGE